MLKLSNDHGGLYALFTKLALYLNHIDLKYSYTRRLEALS